MFGRRRTNKDERPPPVEQKLSDETIVRTVSLEGDPDDVAEQLIGDVPGGRLDELRVRGDAGVAVVFKCLMMRRGFASIERDEIIGFVEHNRQCAATLMKALAAFAEAGSRVEDGEELSHYFGYLCEQFGYAVNGRYESLNVRSDKLFWLIYVLNGQLSSGKIKYEDIRFRLSRPDVKARISSHQLIYMLSDYSESYAKPNQPSSDMLAIIALAACIGRKPREAAASLGIGLKIGGFRAGADCLRMLEDAYGYLASQGMADQEDRTRLDNLTKRFAVRARNDF